MNTQNIEKVPPDIIVAGRPCFTRQALAKALGKSEQTIAGWSTRGFGPPYLLIGRRVLYPHQEVLTWLNSKLVVPEENERPSNSNAKR